MENKYKSLLSNTIIFASGTIGAKLIMFFLLPLYTNVLTKEEFGVAELVMTFSELLIPFICLSIGSAVLRFGLDDKHDEDIVLKNAFGVQIIGSLVAIIISPLIKLYSPTSNYVHLLIMITIATSFRTSLQFYAKATGKNTVFAVDGIINALVLALSNIFFLVVLKKGVNGYLYAHLLSILFSVAFLTISNKVITKLLKKHINIQITKEMLRYSAPLIINAVSWWLIHSTDKFMLQSYMDIDSVGIYTAASKIPSLLNTVTYFFSQAWVISAITEYDSNRDAHFYENVYKIYQGFLCLFVSLFMIVLKPFMSIYMGAEFVVSWHFVPVLLVAAVFRNYSDFFGAFFTSAKKNVAVTITTISGAITNILLNAVLIPIIGIQGATIATMISYMVIGAYRQIASYKYMPIHIDVRQSTINYFIIILEAVILVLDKQIYLLSFICLLLIVFNNQKDLIYIFMRIKNAIKKDK